MKSKLLQTLTIVVLFGCRNSDCGRYEAIEGDTDYPFEQKIIDTKTGTLYIIQDTDSWRGGTVIEISITGERRLMEYVKSN